MTNVDLVKNEDCSDNIVLSKVDDLNLIKESLDPESTECLNSVAKFHSIICVAGGWTGGSIKDDNLVQVYQEMHQKNVVPALICNSFLTSFRQPLGHEVLATPRPTGVHGRALSFQRSHAKHDRIRVGQNSSSHDRHPVGGGKRAA